MKVLYQMTGPRMGVTRRPAPTPTLPHVHPHRTLAQSGTRQAPTHTHSHPPHFRGERESLSHESHQRPSSFSRAIDLFALSNPLLSRLSQTHGGFQVPFLLGELRMASTTRSTGMVGSGGHKSGCCPPRETGVHVETR